MALHKATDPKADVNFHLITPKTKSRIVQVVKDPTIGQDLDRKTPVRGFEIPKDRTFSSIPRELKALSGRRQPEGSGAAASCWIAGRATCSPKPSKLRICPGNTVSRIDFSTDPPGQLHDNDPL